MIQPKVTMNLVLEINHVTGLERAGVTLPRKRINVSHLRASSSGTTIDKTLGQCATFGLTRAIVRR
jgi:hypothetical protein